MTALREIKLLRELDSPHIVRLLDVFPHKQNLNLVISQLRRSLGYVCGPTWTCMVPLLCCSLLTPGVSIGTHWSIASDWECVLGIATSEYNDISVSARHSVASCWIPVILFIGKRSCMIYICEQQTGQRYTNKRSHGHAGMHIHTRTHRQYTHTRTHASARTHTHTCTHTHMPNHPPADVIFPLQELTHYVYWSLVLMCRNTDIGLEAVTFMGLDFTTQIFMCQSLGDDDAW